MRLLLDLTAQVADATAGTRTRAVAHQALDGIRRGVVAYSSVTD